MKKAANKSNNIWQHVVVLGGFDPLKSQFIFFLNSSFNYFLSLKPRSCNRACVFFVRPFSEIKSKSERNIIKPEIIARIVDSSARKMAISNCFLLALRL